MKDALKKFKYPFRKNASTFVLLVAVLVACNNVGVPIPKPRAYPKVIFPEKTYISFDSLGCPFQSELPTYVEVKQQNEFFGEKTDHPCWFDIFYPAYNCSVHCSYYEIGGENSFDKLHGDAFRMVLEHNERANDLQEKFVRNANDVSGYVFSLDGPAASPYQFYLSDSTTHYIRGAVYFNTQINIDSLAPIYAYVKADVDHFIQAFKWK